MAFPPWFEQVLCVNSVGRKLGTAACAIAYDKKMEVVSPVILFVVRGS
jgi:hypothetical protein